MRPPPGQAQTDDAPKRSMSLGAIQRIAFPCGRAVAIFRCRNNIEIAGKGKSLHNRAGSARALQRRHPVQLVDIFFVLPVIVGRVAIWQINRVTRSAPLSVETTASMVAHCHLRWRTARHIQWQFGDSATPLRVSARQSRHYSQVPLSRRGKASSTHFNSCKPTTSGCTSSNQRSTLGSALD